MNILIPLSWLKEYLETDASPQKMADCLSLASASVENLKRVGEDWIYEIEITTNRVDMMSVAGIAKEAAAILPQFSIKAKLKKDPYDQKSRRRRGSPLAAKINPAEAGQKSKIKRSLPLKVIIKDQKLCPRFTAVILDNVIIKPSPPRISQRLEKSGIRSLNNVIDVSNYLMRELGQPVHAFDYDKIKKQTMILRESRHGEALTTLDNKQHLLPGKDIVIEDGEGRLIDLCGIMGGKNSAIDSQTKRVLFFVQTYDPLHIRQTSMKLAHHTEASQLFEKGTDPELVMPTLTAGIKLLKELAGAKVASKIYDLYPQPYKEKSISTSLQYIEERLGVPLSSIKVENLLEKLGFRVIISGHDSLKIRIPSWRAKDISIPEDIVEEVARIYGYHHLPSVLPKGDLPLTFNDQTFYWEKAVKHTLKNWGYTETYTYSLQSEKWLQKFKLEPTDHLKLKNPLSSDWIYLRTSLLPSILAVVSQNSNYEKCHLFELSKVYLSQQNDLPLEVQRLSLVTTDDFYKLKGITEQLLREMNIDYYFEPHEKITQLHPYRSAIIKHKKDHLILGIMGQVFSPILRNFALKKPIVIADLNFDKLIALAKGYHQYTPLPKYPPIIEHLTFINQSGILVRDVLATASKTHQLINQVKIISTFKNKITLEVTYQSPTSSLRDKEVTKIRQQIVSNLEKLGLALHGKLS